MTEEEKNQIKRLVQSARNIQRALWLTATVWLVLLAGIVIQQVLFANGSEAALPVAAVVVLIVILAAVTAYPILLLVQRQRLTKAVRQALPQEQLRSTAQVADPIATVTDLGTHYLVVAPLASITLPKGPTQIEVDPQADQSTYK